MPGQRRSGRLAHNRPGSGRRGLIVLSHSAPELSALMPISSCLRPSVRSRSTR